MISNESALAMALARTKQKLEREREENEELHKNLDECVELLESIGSCCLDCDDCHKKIDAAIRNYKRGDKC